MPSKKIKPHSHTKRQPESSWPSPKQPLDLSNSTMKLKVWWIPQIPMKPFEVFVSSFAQAKVLLETLAQYDLFQLVNKIKPDFSNAGGLMVLEGSKWVDFYTEESAISPGDESIDNLTLDQCIELDVNAATKFLIDALQKHKKK